MVSAGVGAAAGLSAGVATHLLGVDVMPASPGQRRVEAVWGARPSRRVLLVRFVPPEARPG